MPILHPGKKMGLPGHDNRYVFIRGTTNYGQILTHRRIAGQGQEPCKNIWVKILTSGPRWGISRDLPKKELGVDVDHNFNPKYVTIEGKTKTIQDLRKAAVNIKDVYLGPDPDREGEAIAWHIAEVLNSGKHNFHRVLFYELTPKSH